MKQNTYKSVDLYGIKEAFLELINQHSYSQITVAQVCRQAEITRSTFYLHFNNLTDVLNSVLDDALMISQNNAGSLPLTNNISIDYLKQNESLLPTCQRIANSQKYRALLMDPDLSEYIIGRIANHERASTISLIQERTTGACAGSAMSISRGSGCKPREAYPTPP